MMVNRLECENCGATIDYLSRDMLPVCRDCGELMDFAGKVGCVRGLSEGETPNSHLEILREEWEAAAKDERGTEMTAREAFEICADELEHAIVDGDANE